MLCTVKSPVCTVGLWETRPPGCRLDGQALTEEGPKDGKGESCKVTALFLSPPSLQARDWLSTPCAGPGKLPRGPHPLGALLGLLHYLHQVGKVTWLRPYVGPERASGDDLEAFPGGQEPKGTTGGSAQFRSLLPGRSWKQPTAACPTDPGSSLDCYPGDPVSGCLIVTATTKAPSRSRVRQLRMEDSPGLAQDFISLDNILSGRVWLLGT